MPLSLFSLTTPCLTCQARGRLIALSPSSSIRYASSSSRKSLRRIPARMQLSQNVSNPIQYGDSKPPPRRLPNSPFGGMNQTIPPTHTRRQNRNQRSHAQQLRSTPKHSPKNTASKEDSPLFKALKMQAMLTPIHYEKRNQIKSKIEDITTFSSFDLSPVIQDAIRNTLFAGFSEITPTPIQRLAIPALLDDSPAKPPKRIPSSSPAEGHEFLPYNFKQFLLAAETGSGKTLAYILPVIDAVKKEEALQKQEEELKARQKAEEEELRRKSRAFELDDPVPEVAQDVARPRAIILVPTAELVTQIAKILKQLSHTIKFRTVMLSSSFTPRRIANNLFQPHGVDIIVSTPHLMASIAKTHPLILSKVSHIVVDEADSLLDRSFAPTTNELIDKTAPTLKRLIMSSATIPRALDTHLIKRFPQTKRLVTPNLHAVPRRIQLGVVDVQKEPYRGNKKMACADVIWTIGKAGSASDVDPVRSAMGLPIRKHLIVFVNERDTVDEIVTYLNNKGIEAVGLTRDTSEQRQSDILNEFTSAKPPATEQDLRLAQRLKKQQTAGPLPFVDSAKSHQQSTHHLPDVKVLVTTDLGSRGIDTVAVRTVILYDVPYTTVDFIHRLGRAGRMNRRGRGIVLVGKKDRKDVVREVRDAMFRGQALV
ncbi:RNA helicase [Ascosphaera aggregata]|nr:RNA helicase [Ascosphaera aggregata]